MNIVALGRQGNSASDFCFSICTFNKIKCLNKPCVPKFFRGKLQNIVCAGKGPNETVLLRRTCWSGVLCSYS